MKITTDDLCDGKPHALHVYEVLDDNETYAVVARTIPEAVAFYRAWREDHLGESAADWVEPDGGVLRKYGEVIVKPNYEHDWDVSDEGDSRVCKRCDREEIRDDGIWGLA